LARLCRAVGRRQDRRAGIAGLGFIAAGFEHCVANMYFLPLAWLMTSMGKVPDGFDASAITLSGIVHNLVPVTLGNIVGGAGLVGAMYWMIYRAALR
jgi:formate/nitrite transporter FocA (FNT family)